MMKFICADAIPWLSEHQNVGSIVTSLPDASEMRIGIDIDPNQIALAIQK